MASSRLLVFHRIVPSSHRLGICFQKPVRVSSLVTLLSSSRRYFHCTSVFLMVSRRRRGGAAEPAPIGNEKEYDNTNSKDVMSTHQFRNAAGELLSKLFAALEPLGPPLNDPFVLLRDMEEDVGEYLLIDLGPSKGQYKLKVDEENQHIRLSSPISGEIYYMHSKGKFVGVLDGHILEGLLVRDLIRQIYGVPKL